MNRKCLCLIGSFGVVGTLLLTANVCASDGGAKIDYDREWAPYVTVRGGWLFGKTKYKRWIKAPGVTISDQQTGNIKNAWSGSVEFGKSYDDRVFVGLELGYFTGKARFKKDIGRGIVWEEKANGKIENYFGACNVTLRHDVGARAFLYGGVGAGIARSKVSADVEYRVTGIIPPVVESSKESKSKWRFLGQAFAGIGAYLNENWQFMAGYRFRYVPGSFCWKEKDSAVEWGRWSVKQDIIHAAEVGLTYQF